MSSQNIVIECRNKTADNSLSNGDWTTSLPESVKIEEGDQILIKSSFIDTQQTSSSKILIPNDITVSIDFSLYQIANEMKEWIFIDGTPASNPTFDNYILSRRISNLDPDMKLVGEYFLTTDTPTAGSDAVDIDFFWDDENDNRVDLKVAIPALQPNQKYKVKELSGKLVNTSVSTVQTLSRYNLKVLGAVYEDTTGKDLLQPYEMTKNISIKKGNYNPDELCSLINTEMTNNLINEELFTLEDNQILQSARQIQSRFHAMAVNTSAFFLTRASAVDASNRTYIFDVMDTYPTITGSSKDVLLGSSQFEIAFDQNTQNFKLNYIHTPHYVNSAISVSYVEDSNSPGDYYVVNKTGGIYFNRLYATNTSDGSTFDFWNAILGFDVDSLIPEFDFEDVTFTFKGTTTDYLYPSTTQLIDAQTITGQSSSVANVLDVSDVPIYEIPPFDRGVDSASTRSIIAGTSALDVQFNFGYYIVEVNSQFKNTFLTEENNYRNIQQIVSRYYELNSYTNGNSDGSIIYEHSGEPVLLQSFKCRILDSDKNLASNIGNDNTLHIEIVKAPKEENN